MSRTIRGALCVFVAAIAGMSACHTQAGQKPPAASLRVMTVAQRQALTDTLTQLGEEDQRGREDLGRAFVASDTVTILASMRADSARSLWLRGMVRMYGWPTPVLVGDRAANAAWLILQHSPFVDFQREMLPVLEAGVARGEIGSSDYATLVDRVLVRHGTPQRYGTQFRIEHGKLVAEPIEALSELDARRAVMNMPAMSAYARVLGEVYGLPVVWPPTPPSSR